MDAELLALTMGRSMASPKTTEIATVPEEPQSGNAAHNSNSLHTQREMVLDKYMVSDDMHARLLEMTGADLLFFNVAKRTRANPDWDQEFGVVDT